MKVFKFGGASVKDASGIKNLAAIVSREHDDLIIVVSAFGKTTNAMEKVLEAWLSENDDYLVLLQETYLNHIHIIEKLFDETTMVKGKIDDSFAILNNYLNKNEKSSYDYEYDQIVSYGEIWSTIIVAGFLNMTGLISKWVDIRKYLVTDNRFRDANVLWDESRIKIKSEFNFENVHRYLTQGFIAGAITGESTTLGREGSDYTAAILGNILDAEKVIVWKDVPGLLNADPKWFPDAQKLDEVSYKEAVEMTFSGAKIIHPKTIKPLHNKNIPLHVMSFLFPEEEGTVIKSDATLRKVLPVFIKKEDQILISILPRDFSFVMGEHLSRIFYFFPAHGIRVNLVEASAVSINVCVDDDRLKVNALLDELETEYTAIYNEHVEILSVRHYTPESIERIKKGREVLLEQRTRTTVRYIVRKIKDKSEKTKVGK